MSLINSTAIPSGASAYEIDQSLRFEDGDSAYLSRTPSSAGNRKTWTWSGWVKRGNLGGPQLVLFAHSGNNNTDYGGIIINSDVFEFTCYSAAACTTPSLMRDTSSWYHLMCVMDTTQATQADRIKLYRNGELLTKTIAAAYPAQNANMSINAATGHSISGRNPFGGSQYFDGYLAEVNFIDGLAKAPADFGETGTYGEWKPIEYSGSYGTNGFYLNFATASDMGDDKSGNTNDWTENNIAATDQMLDSPTNNFCTMNPVDTQVVDKMSEGNLFIDAAYRCRGTMAVSSGKWYFEVFMKYQHHGGLGMGIRQVGGAIANDTGVNQIGMSHPVGSGVQYGLYVDGSDSTGGEVGTVPNGVIIGISFDVDAQTISFKSNNAAIHTSLTDFDYSACSNMETVTPFLSIPGGRQVIVNFGQDSSFAGNKTAQGNQDGNDIGDFTYTPPSGYLALCTKNLPDATVIPSEHFNTVLYTGNGSDNRSIGLVGFQPDLLWIKERSSNSSHIVSDAVRGATKQLKPNSTGAESSNADEIQAFESDGFQLGTEGSVNENTQTYVAWNWKANGSGASNTNGSITSSVSANVDAGFSIVSYTGASGAATVGHGLSKAPELIITKNKTGYNWGVYNYISGATKYLYLNTTAAVGTYQHYWNNTEPTSSVFSVGTDVVANGHTHGMIAYCFHSVDGYSKVGSYTGNGNADGTFVYTGFRPSYVMVKRTDGVTHWQIHDTARDTSNVMGYQLHANANDADASASPYYIDSVSNGFKLRMTHAGQNANGGNYIYIAFAESPFKYSNAR